MSKTYIFVIDTNKYAGNFEREMTAFMTGEVGGCGVGEELASEFHEEFTDAPDDSPAKNLPYVEQRPDDSGCSRPTSIWHAPNGSEYNSVAIFFEDELDETNRGFLMERAKKFADANKLKITGFRVLLEETLQKEIWNEKVG